MVYIHDGRDTHDRLKYNGTRSTPTMARNSGIDVAVVGLEAFKSPIKLDSLSRAILIESRVITSRVATRTEFFLPRRRRFLVPRVA